jgi:hypothetical protein
VHPSATPFYGVSGPGIHEAAGRDEKSDDARRFLPTRQKVNGTVLAVAGMFVLEADLLGCACPPLGARRDDERDGRRLRVLIDDVADPDLARSFADRVGKVLDPERQREPQARAVLHME